MRRTEEMARRRYEWRHQELAGNGWDKLDEPSQRLETNAMRVALSTLLEPSDWQTTLFENLLDVIDGSDSPFVDIIDMRDVFCRALLE